MGHEMAKRTQFHGPENAEYELRKAYNVVIETGVTHFFGERPKIPGVNPEEVVTIYKRAFNAYRRDERLAAERWARTAKHLARAFWHEAKIAYLEPRVGELPFLSGAREEYNLHDGEREDTTEDLLNSVELTPPPGFAELPEEARRYVSRARRHLTTLTTGSYKHELCRAERIKAAHEYGRVVECMALALEAENQPPGKRAA